MTVEVAEVLPQGEVRLAVANHGGPGKLTTFGAVQGGKACIGNLPPTAYMRPGESRVLKLDLPPDPSKQAVAVVTCYDVRGQRLYAWSATNKQRVWRVRGWRAVGDKSLDDVFQHFYPGVRPTSYPLAASELLERIP